MDPELLLHLNKLASDYEECGIWAFLQLTPEEFAYLEKGLSSTISKAEGIEFNEFIQLRFLLRIFLKFGQDIERGINRISKYSQL